MKLYVAKKDKIYNGWTRETIGANMNTMTPEHKRWDEFAEMLEGPTGCNLQEDESGKITWQCGGGHNKDYAAVLLLGFDVDVDKSLSYFDNHGGHCDCEILFNVT